LLCGANKRIVKSFRCTVGKFFPPIEFGSVTVSTTMERVIATIPTMEPSADSTSYLRISAPAASDPYAKD
jgi:hypothetical protein